MSSESLAHNAEYRAGNSSSLKAYPEDYGYCPRCGAWATHPCRTGKFAQEWLEEPCYPQRPGIGRHQRALLEGRVSGTDGLGVGE